MSPAWNVKPPKDDNEYFERMTKSVFTAGLNWSVIEKKWPNFQKAFSGFSIGKVAGFSTKNVKNLVQDAGIVRNERKIVATVHNAGEFLKLQKEFVSFTKYLDSYGKNEEQLLENLQELGRPVNSQTIANFLHLFHYFES